MDTKNFFLHTLNDLDSKCKDSSNYDLINISALLRKLLIDSTPLIHIVNRDIRLKIRFKVQQRNRMIPQIGKLELHGITPHKDLAITELTLDQFLSFNVISFHLYQYSVHEIILFTAHKLGGVHFDIYNLEGQKENALDKLRIGGPKIGFLNNQPTDIITALMIPIALVTYDALLPMKEKIIAEKNTTHS